MTTNHGGIIHDEGPSVALVIDSMGRWRVNLGDGVFWLGMKIEQLPLVPTVHIDGRSFPVRGTSSYWGRPERFSGTRIYSAYRCLLDFGVRMYDGTEKSRFVDITISKRKCSNDLGLTGAESTWTELMAFEVRKARGDGWSAYITCDIDTSEHISHLCLAHNTNIPHMFSSRYRFVG